MCVPFRVNAANGLVIAPVNSRHYKHWSLDANKNQKNDVWKREMVFRKRKRKSVYVNREKKTHGLENGCCRSVSLRRQNTIVNFIYTTINAHARTHTQYYTHANVLHIIHWQILIIIVSALALRVATREKNTRGRPTPAVDGRFFYTDIS